MSFFILSVNIMTPIIAMIAIGYFLKRKGIIDDEFVNISSTIVFKMALPATLFYNTANSDLSIHINNNTLSFLCITCGILTVTYFIGVFIASKTNWNKKTKGAFIQGVFRSNYVIIGYPILISLCGEEVIFEMTLLAICIIPIFNTLAVITLTINNPDNKKLNIKNIVYNVFKNPLILSILSGFIITLMGINIPSFINNTLVTIKGLTTPLALINIGSMFCFRININNKKPLFIAVFFKTIFTPVVFTLLAIWIGFRNSTLAIMFIVFATPTAASSFIMAKVMNSNDELASSIVVVSTTLSSLTIFIGIIILKSYGLI